jgi:hypothetical protein
MKDLLSAGKGPRDEPVSSAPTVDPSLRATVLASLHGASGAALRITRRALEAAAFIMEVRSRMQTRFYEWYRDGRGGL